MACVDQLTSFWAAGVGRYDDAYGRRGSVWLYLLRGMFIKACVCGIDVDIIYKVKQMLLRE